MLLFRRCCLPLIEFPCDFPWHFSEDITPNLKFLSCSLPWPAVKFPGSRGRGTWRSLKPPLRLSVNFGGMCWKIQVIHGCLAVSGKVWPKTSCSALLISSQWILDILDLGHMQFPYPLHPCVFVKLQREAEAALQLGIFSRQLRFGPGATENGHGL